MSDIEKSTREFEAWHQTNWASPVDFKRGYNDMYESEHIQDQWEAWQASENISVKRIAELEDTTRNNFELISEQIDVAVNPDSDGLYEHRFKFNDRLSQQTELFIRSELEAEYDDLSVDYVLVRKARDDLLEQVKVMREQTLDRIMKEYTEASDDAMWEPPHPIF